MEQKQIDPWPFPSVNSNCPTFTRAEAMHIASVLGIGFSETGKVRCVSKELREEMYRLMDKAILHAKNNPQDRQGPENIPNAITSLLRYALGE